MSTSIEISKDFLHEITRRSEASAGWALSLPDTIEKMLAKWSLLVDGSPSYGKTSVVIPVASGNRNCALKLVSPVVDMASEARALRLFSGTAIVDLINKSEPDRAMLMERLEPIAPMDVKPPETAVEIAGSIAASLATVSAPPDERTLAGDSPGWLIGLQQQHRIAESNGTSFTNDQFALALEIIASMAQMQTSTMTHGDLSMENILSKAPGDWVAIDPMLLCGPVENEAHTVVRSFLPAIFEAERPGEMLDDLTCRFCESATADFQTARRISYARYVASYYWESQNSGDSENANRLRNATLLIYEAIRCS